MPVNPEQIPIYHITDVANLPNILAGGGLLSDAAMAIKPHTVIGYDHIKQRRLTETHIACCGNRFVGEFVPFYFCPRSPMLYVINKGKTGRPEGCQRNILHLVSTVAVGIGLGRVWAVSDGNAAASYSSFFNELDALENFDWRAIRALDWRNCKSEKSAEFLVADSFPFEAVNTIGCHNSEVAKTVTMMLSNHAHRPQVKVQPDWYY